MSYGDFSGLNGGGTYTVFWASRDGTQVQQLLREETVPDGVTNRFAEVPRMSDATVDKIMFSALEAYSSGAPATGWKLFLHDRL